MKFIGICVRTIILTLLAIICAKNLNFFHGFSNISNGQAFDIGLACYLTIFEAGCSTIINIIQSKRANIIIIFYDRENNYSESNCPIMICNHIRGVCSIKCRIKLDGNVDRLRNAEIAIDLPHWLSSQTQIPHYTYDNNRINFCFDNVLPDSGTAHNIVQDIDIPFAINSENTKLEITLLPKLICRDLMINLTSNGFRAKIR